METPLRRDIAGSNCPNSCEAGPIASRTSSPLPHASRLKLLMAPLLLLLASLTQLPAAVIYSPTSFSYSVGTGGQGPGTTVLAVDLSGLNDLAVICFSYVGAVPVSNFYQFTILNSGTAAIAADIVEGLYYGHSLNAGQTWDNLPGGQTVTPFGANISRMAQTGNSSVLLRSDPTYLPFYFTDTTDSATKYGYISLATSVTGTGASAEFHLDVSGYAYESSGAKIAMGAIPEPSASALSFAGVFAVLAWRWQARREA